MVSIVLHTANHGREELASILQVTEQVENGLIYQIGANHGGALSYLFNHANDK